MPTLSPLATLVATLAEVCHQAQQHQPLLSKNEAATRAALIDPVLRALGWDTADVSLVLPEYAVSNKQRPDYFLRRKNGETHIVIEAKKLGEDLDKLGHTGKLIGYAFTLKPVYHFVTDGLEWHCYSPSHSQYEPYVHIALSADNLLAAALQLLQLLDAAHGGHGLPAPKENPSALPTAKTQPTPAQPPTPQLTKKIIAARPYQQLTVALVSGSSFGKPAWLRLPDGTEQPLKSWRDILVKSVELVLSVCPDLKLPLADKAGKKTKLVSREQPTNGLSHTTINYQEKPTYIYTNYDATNCVANALYIFKLLPKKNQQAEPAIAFAS